MSLLLLKNTMFDISSDEINLLNDTDLRELVGQLCEAELISRGLSPAAVTWGGNQTAPDGGLDVRVELPQGTTIGGFIARSSTGFQVKKPDMPRTEIISEMRPTGAIRPVIQELADAAGSYVMVSSSGSTADGALRNRRDALREALDGVGNAALLHTDFYDRTRLATWVRQYPGLITWVKERVGRALIGWRPYGSWSGAAEGVDAEYLLDDKLRLHLGKQADDPGRSVAQAIDELRDELAQPGKIVRLVGLSGVGKTRLVQALFDAGVGSRPLPPSLAVYTNLSDDPNPQPIGLASDLIAKRTRAILVVDNCPPDLHRRLSELCGGQRSTVSVISVEYDVRDDQPEGTQVVTLDTSSAELITQLVRRRYQHLSVVDARTIAEASGGNARIAIALAETVERSDTISGLSNDELFQRLFRQRQDPNGALLLAAQVCSLVYSFHGEALIGEEAELPRLAALADQAPIETYRHVGELLRRNLAQQRGDWRAVLPHAIANRLAARALEDLPYELINQQFVEGGTERLARSFSRRLSFLHDHPRAVAIVEGWLAPNGLLGDVATLNDCGRAMFENIAPVLPEATLMALERVCNGHPNADALAWERYLPLLRSLAYAPPLFERSARVLVWVVMWSRHEGHARMASDIFVSLSALYLSGTHATIEQRLGVIEPLLRSDEAKARALGLAALGQVLEATHFTSHYRFEFGARSRSYGYRPRCGADVAHWYGSTLTLIEHLALDAEVLKTELRDLLARKFRGLWHAGHVHRELVRLARRFAEGRFWCEGWIACRQAMRFDKETLEPEVASLLTALEEELKPSNLQEQVRAVVLGNRPGRPELLELDADDDPVSAHELSEVQARELGMAVAVDNEVLAELLPDLFRGGNRAWAFGRGFAMASQDRNATWTRLVEALERTPPDQRNIQVLRGFVAELWEQERSLAQCLLDCACEHPVLRMFLPELYSTVDLDEHRVEQLKQALRAGHSPIRMYRNLAFGRITEHLSGEALKGLLLLIADQADGFDVAQEILHMRLYSDRSAQREYESELLEAGRVLLQRASFQNTNQSGDYELAEIARACLIGLDSASLAMLLASRLKQAVSAYETHAYAHADLLKALLEVQPMATLSALFDGDEEEQEEGISVLRPLGEHQGNPMDVIPCDMLIAWCDEDCESRYALAASIITFANRPEASAPLIWSEQARALLTHAPDPRSVLEALIARFQPMSWSGSRAAIMEENARLLDGLGPLVSSDITPFLTEARTRLAREVAEERQRETERDRATDERFEW